MNRYVTHLYSELPSNPLVIFLFPHRLLLHKLLPPLLFSQRARIILCSSVPNSFLPSFHRLAKAFHETIAIVPHQGSMYLSFTSDSPQTAINRVGRGRLFCQTAGAHLVRVCNYWEDVVSPFFISRDFTLALINFL